MPEALKKANNPKCVRLVHADKVEVAVMYRITDMLRNEKALVQEVEGQLGSQRSRIAEVEQRIADYTKTVDELEAKISIQAEKNVKGPAKAVIEAAINKLSDQLAAAKSAREDAVREREAIGASTVDAKRIAEHIRYLVGSPKEGGAVRWSFANKKQALDTVFGGLSVRCKTGVGIYLEHTGALTLRTALPLAAIVSKVQPGELGRPRLMPKELFPTTDTSTRCRCR